jgi:hypothetical protein
MVKTRPTYVYYFHNFILQLAVHWGTEPLKVNLKAVSGSFHFTVFPSVGFELRSSVAI